MVKIKWKEKFFKIKMKADIAKEAKSGFFIWEKEIKEVFSKFLLARKNKIKLKNWEIKVALAAPTMPNFKIKIRFKKKFKAALAKEKRAFFLWRL